MPIACEFNALSQRGPIELFIVIELTFALPTNMPQTDFCNRRQHLTSSFSLWEKVGMRGLD
ncbi:hypothetical protein BFS14_11500 [Serratia fonticola]|nr:hypothetical protein BFS14_11500 [Serratia fonticola]